MCSGAACHIEPIKTAIPLLCSEPETALILALAQTFEPHVWLNVHSGMEALFMPYDHRADIPPGEQALATLHILEDLNK